jgi:hypothetical protein
LNTASLTTVVDNLYRQNFLIEATYQEVRRLTELGGVYERSHLLCYVVEDWNRRWVESFPPNETFIYGSIDEPCETAIYDEMPFAELQQSPLIMIVGEMPFAELQQSLQRLNDTGVLSPPVYQQLQEELAAGHIRLDVDLFQQAKTRMQQYERL